MVSFVVILHLYRMVSFVVILHLYRMVSLPFLLDDVKLRLWSWRRTEVGYECTISCTKLNGKKVWNFFMFASWVSWHKCVGGERVRWNITVIFCVWNMFCWDMLRNSHIWNMFGEKFQGSAVSKTQKSDTCGDRGSHWNTGFLLYFSVAFGLSGIYSSLPGCDTVVLVV